jgi:hypothetical protein
MKKFSFTIFELKEKHLYFSIIISFLIIAYYHLNSGFHMSPDSYKFSGWADDLIKSNFNLYDFYFIEKSTNERIPSFFFTVPILLTALCKAFFGNEWQYGFLLFNLALVFFSIVIFMKTLLIVRVRSFLIFLTLPLIVISVDLLTWPRYILSDMSYVFLVVLAIYFMTKGFVKNKFNYFQIFLMIFLMLITRPSSISVIFAIVFFIAISKYQFLLKPRKILVFVFILFILVPLAFGLLYHYIELNFSANMQLEWWLLSKVKVGMIIHDRPETWVDSPRDFKDVVNIYFLRLVNFFNPYAENFSIIHIVLNFLQTFIILLSITIWSFFGGITKYQDKLFCFIILLSFSVAAFHSFTLIDYDWRYRFPIIIPLIMLFPISIEMILKRSLKSN